MFKRCIRLRESQQSHIRLCENYSRVSINSLIVTNAVNTIRGRKDIEEVSMCVMYLPYSPPFSPVHDSIPACLVKAKPNPIIPFLVLIHFKFLK